MNKEPSLLTGSDRIMPAYIRKPFTIISIVRAEREAWFQPRRKWWFIKCKDRPNQILEQGVSPVDVIPQCSRQKYRRVMKARVVWAMMT
jgi:hypothetical protein